ncbi:type VI secretion system contractile sheath domain-containing protein [Pseudooceanicola sp.]
MERVEEVAEKDNTVEDSAPEEDSSDVLAAMERVETVEEEDSDLDDLLAGLETPKDTADDAPDVGGILSGIEPAQTEEVADDTAAVLGSLDSPAPDAQEEQSVGDVLGGLEAPEEEGGEDDTADILADLEPVEEAGEETDLDALLNDLDSPEPETGTDAGDVLAALDPVEDTPETETADDVLAGLEATEVAEEADDLDALLSGLDTPEEAGGEPDAPLEESGDSDPEVGFDATDQTGSPEEPDDAGDDLDALLGELDDAPAIDPEDDDQAAALTDPDDVDGTAKHEDADDLDALLSGLEDDMPSEEPEEEDDDLDALLADLEGGDDADVVATHEAESADGDDDLDALLAGLDDDDAPQAEAPGDTDTDDEDLDALLAGFDDDPVAEEPEAEPEPDDDDLDALLADLDGADDDTGDEGSDDADTEDDDLDALLADLEASDDEEDEASEEDGDDDLDALLAGLEADDDAPETESDDDLDALMADLGDDDGGEAAVGAAPDTPAPVPQSPFGRISAPRPERGTLNRSKFRIALFGDFTGRAARGLRETGSALAARPPILLDVDTVEEVIEGFATTLTLPIGKDGAGIEVKLGEFDDLHPDELYENIPIFDELSGLRRQLGTGSMADKAKERLKAWGEAHGTPVRLPKRSASTSVPANLKLSDFQALIGDTSNTLSSGGPIDDLIARIVGPHIVKAPDAGTEAMLAAVDEALSSAMRLVLHHPDFQAIEAQWRSLDLLARRIETDSSLEIVLYDVSAEELAIDLAAQEDLAESGLFDLLTGVLDPEEGAGGFSALFGLYTFEETPPHAELLARIGQVARHVDAPFFTAMTPGFLDVAKEDRHRLTAETWDKLRTTPEAAYLGLASPRVLLRLPYGKKSDPCYAFDFEEFTPQEGLSGMLWANPAVVVAILLAATYKKDGKAMEPGSVMSLGDMPFHYVTDRYGDQVALPCTERNLTADPVQHTLARGFMPLVSVKGRNEVRLGSFRSLAGTPIAGSWADGPAPGAAPPDADIQMDIAVDPDGPSEDEDLDTEATETDGTGDDDLDALLAGFDDDDDSTGDGEDADEMDPELAALLDGL